MPHPSANRWPTPSWPRHHAVPSDVALFSSIYPTGAQGFYPTGPPMVPASGPAVTEAGARAQLEAFLADMYPGQPMTIARALAVFDDPDVETVVTPPALRAALAGQVGTPQEPALDLLDRYALVRYGSLPNTSFIAGSAGGDVDRVVSVNNRYATEDFRYLVGIMAHELFHHDVSNPQSEEAVLNTLSALDYMRVLLVYPELAHTGTELSRQMNDLVLIYLNSREWVPRSVRSTPHRLRDRARQPPQRSRRMDDLRGELHHVDHAARAQRGARSVWDHRHDIVRSANGECLRSDQRRLDHRRQPSSMSVLLGLIDVAEIAALTGLSAAEAITEFELQPFLDAAA